jgi:hypothetical protein
MHGFERLALHEQRQLGEEGLDAGLDLLVEVVAVGHGGANSDEWTPPNQERSGGAVNPKIVITC